MPLVWPVSNVPILLIITVYVRTVCAIVMEKRPAPIWERRGKRLAGNAQ